MGTAVAEGKNFRGNAGRFSAGDEDDFPGTRDYVCG